MNFSTKLRYIAFGSIALSSLFLSSCEESTADKEAKATRPVNTLTIRYTSASQPRTLVGVVKAKIESNLGFRIPGKIAERLVDRGDHVKAGQPIATLDQTDGKLQLEQTKAALSSAQATRDQALAERVRIEQLHQKGWATNSTLDKANATANQAIAAYEQAEKAVTLSENALSYTTLVADADGVVTAALAEPGQVIAAGQPVISLAHADAREADVSIPETLVDQVRESTASVTLWSRPDKIYPAKLRELAPSADPSTRTYSARFSIEGAGPELDLGMTATVTLQEASSAVALVPLGAIFDNGHGPTVFVIDPTTRVLTARPVTIKSYAAKNAVLSSGVSEGETIVTLGVHKLHSGDIVRTIDEAKS